MELRIKKYMNMIQNNEKMIKIVGARGNIQKIEDFIKNVNNFSEKNGIIIQIFDARMIFGKNHLISSVEHAIRSINNGTDTTNSLEKEILLYSSGERQIKIAITKMGIKKNTNKFAIVFLLKNIEILKKIENLISEFLNKNNLQKDDEVLEGDVNELINYGIDERELHTVGEKNWIGLIFEKVAMVDIMK